MLGYLDALVGALTERDVVEAERLLAHPLAKLLPEPVRVEAASFAAGERDVLAAPLRAMQLRHQTAELLRDAGIADQPELPTLDARASVMPPVEPSARAVPSTRHQQMELPLSA